MTGSIGPFRVKSVGPTSVLLLDTSEFEEDPTLIEYESRIHELIAQHHCDALVIDMTDVQSLSRQLITLVIALMKMPQLSIQLLNVSEDVQQTPNGKELHMLVEFVECAQKPSQRMQHCSVRRSDDSIDVILLSVNVIQDSLVIQEMESELHSLVHEDRPGNKILNLKNVNHVGSSGLAMFVQFATRVTRSGGRLVCCNLSKSVKECFAVTRIDTFIKVAPDESAALEFLKN